MTDKEIEAALSIIKNQLKEYDKLVSESGRLYSLITINIKHLQQECPHTEKEITTDEITSAELLTYKYEYHTCALCKKEIEVYCNGTKVIAVDYTNPSVFREK